ncbi:MAG: RNA polymerase sigma factor [Clostridia bacterium]|nr:RNA polymerase sigma factor [Clostridia bacterium]
MKPQSDREICLYLCKMKDGDMDALSALYDATHAPLYALCYSYFQNQYDAEDALSETYLRVVREIGKFNGKSGFNWMYTIAKNICLNMKKKQSREIAVDLQDEKTVNTLDALHNQEMQIEDASGIMALAKRILNDHEYMIVILHAVQGYRFGDIARQIGKIEATVRWQYNNAIKKIRKANGGEPR